jgi:hypothetical protein
MMNKEVVKRYLTIAGVVVLLLVIFNPAKTSYATVEENYFASVRHDAEILGNRKVATAEDKLLLDYGRGVCDTLNAKGKTGNDAVEYLANEAFSEKNSPDENLELVRVVITNAVRHLCPAHIALLD